MILAVRRGLAGAAVGVIVLLGAAGISPASADTASPSPTTATATAKATATGTAPPIACLMPPAAGTNRPSASHGPPATQLAS